MGKNKFPYEIQDWISLISLSNFLLWIWGEVFGEIKVS